MASTAPDQRISTKRLHPDADHREAGLRQRVQRRLIDIIRMQFYTDTAANIIILYQTVDNLDQVFCQQGRRAIAKVKLMAARAALLVLMADRTG